MSSAIRIGTFRALAYIFRAIRAFRFASFNARYHGVRELSGIEGWLLDPVIIDVICLPSKHRVGYEKGFVDSMPGIVWVCLLLGIVFIGFDLAAILRSQRDILKALKSIDDTLKSK